MISESLFKIKESIYNINTEATVSVVNYMLGEAEGGQTIFYDIYSNEGKQANPTKENTGYSHFSVNQTRRLRYFARAARMSPA
jgi:hypothetical protein